MHPLFVKFQLCREMGLTFAQFDDLPRYEQELYYGFLQAEAKAAKIKEKLARFHSSKNGNTTHERTDNGAEPPQPSS